VTDGPQNLQFRLPASPSRLHRARERIRDYLSHQCADDEGIDDVILCLDEAWTNAICHSGSAEDIEVSLGFAGDDLAVRVRDLGRGFDVATLKPHEVPGPLQMSGCGLYIMSELMDELRLQCEDGLEVSMVKRAMRAPARQPATSARGSSPPSTVRREPAAHPWHSVVIGVSMSHKASSLASFETHLHHTNAMMSSLPEDT
jgi:anti-sigma regulatory factor (Ser/Thr protein kinase)